MIIFDVFSEDNYQFTLTQQADVLINEHEMGHQKKIMDPRQLNEVIEMVKLKIETDPN